MIKKRCFSKVFLHTKKLWRFLICIEIYKKNLYSQEVIFMIKWKFKKNDARRSYELLPSGVYCVKIESAVEATSILGNQMVKMILNVIGHNAKEHHLTFSPKHKKIVNKALSEIYSSFSIPSGNLNPQTWIGKVGFAQLEPDEFEGKPYNRIAYFLTKPQQENLGLSADDSDEIMAEEYD